MASSIAWNVAAFCAPAVIHSLPVREVLICCALHQLICKVQQYALKQFFQRFFPSILHTFLALNNQISRDLLNEHYSLIISVFLLKHTKGSVWINTMTLCYFYMTFFKILVSAIALDAILPSCIYKLGSNAYDYLFPLKIHKSPASEKNAEVITSLTKTIEELVDFLETKKVTGIPTFSNCLNSGLVDVISYTPMSLPVQIDKVHYLDEQSLRLYQKKTCPVCRDEIFFTNYKVSEKVQKDIIKQLKEMLDPLRKKFYFFHLPFNQI